MSKETAEKLIANSVAAALSAIEIYNKPHFYYRNEVFCILIVNAWELLLKAKILKDNKYNIDSIYVYNNKGTLKTNRNNSPLTVEIFGAMDMLDMPEPVEKNIACLIDIRDTSIHYISSQPIDYLVYSLGAACLRNYQKLIKDWFRKDLLEYNFYIMPLGFSHSFQSFKLLDLNKEPEEIKRSINSVSENQKNTTPSDGFVFNCEVQINLTSAKRITEDTDLKVAVNPGAAEFVIVEKPQKITDRYPLSSSELWDKLSKAIPMKQNDFYRFLSEKKIRENEKFSCYNFRFKKHEEEYTKTGKVANGTPSLYNYECLTFMTQELPKFLKKK